MQPIPELLQACVAAPEDDAPRLAWAEAIGGERGELVRIQCELERGGLERGRAIAHRRRESELLATREREWAALDGLAEGSIFRRGFVDEAIVDARTFAEKGETLFGAAPLLRRVDFSGLQDSAPDEIVRRLDAVLGSPFFARLFCVRLEEIGGVVETDSDTRRRDFQAAGSEALARLIERKALRSLGSLELPRCALSSSDVGKLAACRDAAGLRELNLRHQEVDRYVGIYSSDVQAILDSPNLAALEALDVAGALGRFVWVGGQSRTERAEAARKQSKRDPAFLSHPRVLALRRLGIAYSGFADEMIDALAGAPFQRLEWLDLSRNDVFPEDFQRIGASPGYDRLVELVFDGPSKYTFGAKIAEALGAVQRLGALRVLRLRNCGMNEATAQILLASPLAQRLELIDLRKNRDVAKAGDKLGKAFDGILLLDKP